MKQVKCADLGNDCDFVAKGTLEEVMSQVADHATGVHKMTITDDVVAAVKGVMTELPKPSQVESFSFTPRDTIQIPISPSKLLPLSRIPILWFLGVWFRAYGIGNVAAKSLEGQYSLTGSISL
jgi:predicted small metal-binding protein